MRMIDQGIRRLATAFAEDYWPPLPCPRCRHGRLNPVESPKLLLNANMADWTEWGAPEDIRGVFATQLQCQNRACRGVVAVTGDFEERLFEDARDPGDTTTMFTIKTVHPPLELVLLPDGVPSTVAEELQVVGALIWTHPASAMTWLRRAVEALMTERGVPAATSSGHFVSLDSRLNTFRLAATTLPEVSDLLESLKWEGNHATHSGVNNTPVHVDDVLSAVERLAHALDLLYPQDYSALVVKAQQINANKGPVL